MTNFAEMNKSELRAACKVAGISYSKLTNDGMRAALEASAPAPVSALDQEFINRCGHSNCPHCGIHLDNGLLHCDDTEANGTRTFRDMGSMTKEWECMGCGEQFGDDVQPSAKSEDRHTGTGLKIEKNRSAQNGVTMPSAGGKCRAVWDALSELLSELDEGERVTAKMVKDLAADEGWNANNASIEFYRWRKFHGFTGRAK